MGKWIWVVWALPSLAVGCGDSPFCGDGVIEGAEVCDDGNIFSDDGCSSTCEVEAGWNCLVGEPTVCTPMCGDGTIADEEECDDGNTQGDDGCVACRVETGWECSGAPSVCVQPLAVMTVSIDGTRLDNGETVAPFDFAPVEATDDAVVTIENDGPGVLTVEMSIAGRNPDEFSSDPAMVTVPSEDSVDVTLTFAPTSGGVKQATLTLTSNDPDNETFDITIDAHTVPNTYRELTPTGAPSARYNTSLVDLRDGRVLMFGGRDSEGTRLSDTWVYDVAANEWTELAPETSPSARDAHEMAWTGESVILFGGNDLNGAMVSGRPTGFGDTWSFDPETGEWAELTPTMAPRPRFQHQMTEAGDGRVILFGGRTDGPTWLEDTWTFDQTTGEWTEAGLGVSITARQSAAFGFDGTRAILFGGSGGMLALFDQTWIYDPAMNQWARQEGATTTPTSRFALEGAYFEESGLFIVYGGKAIYCCDDPDPGTFAWDPDADNWTELTNATEPTPRFNYGFAYIRGTNKAIIFGGATSNMTPASAQGTTYEYVGPLP